MPLSKTVKPGYDLLALIATDNIRTARAAFSIGDMLQRIGELPQAVKKCSLAPAQEKNTSEVMNQSENLSLLWILCFGMTFCNSIHVFPLSFVPFSKIIYFV